MRIDYRLHRLCDFITISIIQDVETLLIASPHLCNRAYAAGDKNLCNSCYLW